MTDRVCVCNWKDCTSFLHSIQASSQCSDDDVWKGPPFRILTKTNAMLNKGANSVQEIDEACQAEDVNRIFGWAVFSVRTKVEKKINRQSEDEDVYDKKYKILMDMSTTERAVIGDADYTSEYYPVIDQILNRGGLTLVPTNYAKLATKCLTIVSRNTSQKVLISKLGEFARDGREAVTKAVDEELLPEFLSLTRDLRVSEDICKDVFHEIVQKVLHAKTGKAISTYKSENMGRGTKGETKSGIREMLKFTAGNNSIAKRKRNDAQEDYAKRKRKDEEED
jgi:hypothetical protein